MGWPGRHLGSILMLVAFVVVGAFVGMDITPEQSLTTFPEIRAARTVEYTLYPRGPAAVGTPLPRAVPRAAPSEPDTALVGAV
jgi:hypothetical protein